MLKFEQKNLLPANPQQKAKKNLTDSANGPLPYSALDFSNGISDTTPLRRPGSYGLPSYFLKKISDTEGENTPISEQEFQGVYAQLPETLRNWLEPLVKLLPPQPTVSERFSLLEERKQRRQMMVEQMQENLGKDHAGFFHSSSGESDDEDTEARSQTPTSPAPNSSTC